ncbi:hypothetical protein GGX14DRAFT_611750 [Mycena pura]|uniref:Uncharacterized protein n=1 Tax=Mycena pura TaxID=153505 RepID=A0AAD6YS53_9AGAR|nr:hypothetical protein GGX14DRAFT_611750 [Mycena pura]
MRRAERRLLPHELEQDPVFEKILPVIRAHHDDDTISCDSHITGVEEYAKANVARGDYKPMRTWLKGMRRWAQSASEVVEDQVPVNDEQIEEAYSREQPRVVTSLDLDKPDYLSMSIYTGSTTSSNQLFAFADFTVELLRNAHIPQLKCATFYEIVSARGPLDAEGALGVNDALANGLWLCPSCHERLGAEVFVLCPPLKILRAIRDDFDPKMTTMQAFLENIYTNNFPKLRFLYQLVRISSEAIDIYMCPGRLVELGPFRLHDTNSPRKEQLSEEVDPTVPAVPHIWSFPGLKPENVMAVLLHKTNERETATELPTSAKVARTATEPMPTDTNSDRADAEMMSDEDSLSTEGSSYNVERVLDSKVLGGKHVLDHINVPGDVNVLGDINVPGDVNVLGDINVPGDVNVLGDIVPGDLNVLGDERKRINKWLRTCMADCMPSADEM